MEDRKYYHHYLPPRPARRFHHYVVYPFLAIRAYFIRLEAVFTLRFLLYLLITQCVIKGILYRIASSTMLPLFKGLGIDAVTMQLYATIASSPWSLKPLVGVISDIVAIRGYHKRFLIVSAIAVGLIGSSILMIPSNTVTVFVVAFVLLNFEMSTVDLLTEGKYAEIMGKNPHSGSDVITFVNGCQMAGSIVAMLFIGPLADEELYIILFVIALALAVSPLIPTLIGWLPEERAGSPHARVTCVTVNTERFKASRAIFIVVAFTGLGGPVMAIITTFAQRVIGLVCAFVIMCGAVIGGYASFPRVIGHVTLYQVLARISKPSIGSAMDYFFTADLACLPKGPNFSYKYYITLTGILGACVSFATVWLYQAWMSKWKFRTVLVFTTALVAVSGIMDMVIVLRWNLIIGIPDKVFYVMGEAILESCVLMLYWIPSSTIISKVCPKGMEASTYAFLAGVSNFAGMVSELLGATIFDAAGIKTTNTTLPDMPGVENGCDFSALWWLILLCHISLPALIGIPSAWLIPDVYQTDSVEIEPAIPLASFNSDVDSDADIYIEF